MVEEEDGKEGEEEEQEEGVWVEKQEDVEEE